jgi:hypothetical protein
MHIKVKVKTDSKKESVTKKAPDSYIISVKERRKEGKQIKELSSYCEIILKVIMK